MSFASTLQRLHASLINSAGTVVFGMEDGTVSIFGLIFGPTWTEAGEYARFLAVAYLAQFAVTPVSSTLFLLERQGQELMWGCVRLLLTAGGTAVCGLLGQPIQVAVIVLAVGHVLSYGVLYGLCLHAADATDARRQRAS